MRRKKALVTAGPTREYLDSVRYLSNASSGKMGIALAQALKAKGFSVTLILGPGIPPPPGIETVSVISAEDMRREVLKKFPACDVFMSAAAVADFRPKVKSRTKRHRNGKPLNIKLVPNPDILFQAGRIKIRQVCVGFALEEKHGRRRALSKLIRKNCDLIVLNGPESMEADFIAPSIIHRGGKIEKLGRISKKAAAQKICRTILQVLPKKS